MTRASRVAEAPYRGIAPFTSDDEDFFFGREVERSVLYAYVRSRPLTVLYGASGVGKSSLLQAGLVGHLLCIAAENLEQRGMPGLAVAVVSSWREAPLKRVLDAVREARPFPHSVAPCDEIASLPVGESLQEALELEASRRGGVLFLLLDQFEDYLRSEADPDFEEALAIIVNSPRSMVRILLSVQEESLARLDRFEERIPGLLADALRLEQLDRQGVERAITGPLEKWNELHAIPAESAYRAEEELIAAIFAHGAIDEVNNADPARTPPTELAMGTAYLQLVIRRLWDKEIGLGSHVLRTSTLLDGLGGIRQVVQEYLDAALASFSVRERKWVAQLLRFLVTPFGDPVALSALDLADYTHRPIDTVEVLLQRLTKARVVRSVVGPKRSTVYEIFHQALVPAIRHWREETTRRGSGWLRPAAIACVSLLVLLLFTLWHSRERRIRLERASALAQHAASLRTSQFDLSLLLSLRALLVGGGDGDPLTLLDSLRSSSALGAFVGWNQSSILRLVCDPGGSVILVAGKDGTIRHWSLANRRLLGPPMSADWNGVSDVAFSHDGRTLALVASDATVRLRLTTDHLFPLASFAVPEALAVALRFDSREIAVGSSSGSVFFGSMPFQTAKLTLQPGATAISTLEFSPDGRFLAIGSEDGSVYLSATRFGAAKTRQLKTPGTSVYCVAFSPDSRKLAAGAADGSLYLWSAIGDEWTEQRFSGNRGVRAVAFGPAGDRVAAADEDGVIRLWSIFTAEPLIEPLVGNRSCVRSLAFAPDGRLVSGQEDGSIRLWTVNAPNHGARGDLESLRDHVCRIVNRDMTVDEWKNYVSKSVPYERTCP